jgi:hypothetical protein
MENPTVSQQRTSVLQFTPDDMNLEQSDSDSDCENEMQRQKHHAEKKNSLVYLHGKESFFQWRASTAFYTNEIRLNQQIQANLADQLLEKTEDAIKIHEEMIALQDHLIRLQIENTKLVNKCDKEENRAEQLLILLQQVQKHNLQQKVQDPYILELLQNV